MIFSEEENEIYDRAMKQARTKAFKRSVASRVVDVFPSEEEPVSVFMAGSPGAGKTEVAKELILNLGGNTLRIDNDEYRSEFNGYDGSNSYLFQDAATRLVEAIHDLALKKHKSFILDSTLSSLKIAESNAILNGHLVGNGLLI